MFPPGHDLRAMGFLLYKFSGGKNKLVEKIQLYQHSRVLYKEKKRQLKVLVPLPFIIVLLFHLDETYDQDYFFAGDLFHGIIRLRKERKYVSKCIMR